MVNLMEDESDDRAEPATSVPILVFFDETTEIGGRSRDAEARLGDLGDRRLHVTLARQV